MCASVCICNTTWSLSKADRGLTRGASKRWNAWILIGNFVVTCANFTNLFGTLFVVSLKSCTSIELWMTFGLFHFATHNACEFFIWIFFAHDGFTAGHFFNGRADLRTNDVFVYRWSVKWKIEVQELTVRKNALKRWENIKSSAQHNFLEAATNCFTCGFPTNV